MASVKLTKEDGSGKTNSTSYATVADGDAYHLGHYYSAAWDDLEDTDKACLLVMASRLIDAEFKFNGRKAIIGQAMQWPRQDCPEPDGATAVFVSADLIDGQARPNGFVEEVGAGQVRILVPSVVVPANVVPKEVVFAACELARELALVDRTASHPGEGLKSFEESHSETDTDTASNTGGTSNQSTGTTNIQTSAVKTAYDKTDTRPIIPRVVQAMLLKYGSMFGGRSGAVNLTRA